jgi:hypothetical protein
MTFRQKAIVLSAAAGVLLVVFVLGELFSPQRLSRMGQSALMFPGFPKAAARRIELSDAGNTVTLVRAEGWSLDIGGTAYPAAEAKIGYLLDGIAELQRGTLVTRNPARAADLGLADAAAVTVVVSGQKGETLCDFSAGRTGAAGSGRYLRASGSSEIFQSGESVSPYITAERRFWANLKVLPQGLRPEAVVRVSVKSQLALAAGKDRRDLDYTLVLGQDSNGKPRWSFAGGGPVPEDKVRQVVDALLSLEGNDFDTTTGAPAHLAARPAATITISFSDSKDLVLFVGPGVQGSQYPCAVSGGSYAYLVAEWRLGQILARRETLISQR